MAKVTIRELIAQSQLYIEAHMDDSIPLDVLAAQSGYSTFHFHSLFTGIVGEGVKEYQRRLKLQRAAMQLLFSARPVIDVALDAGYESQEGFSRAFKKRFSHSPLQFRKLQNRYNFLSEGQLMTTNDATPPKKIDVCIKEFAPIPVAASRYVGPYEDCGPAFTTLFSWAGPLGLWEHPEVILGISYDDPRITPAEKLRYDACIKIAENTDVPAPLQKLTIAGGRYACAIHKGSYLTISRTYTTMLGEWFPESGEELANRPPLEVYVNSPEDTPEEELLTELRVPLE
ncbi:MAG: AraC family transcriptional regulator [Desulfovibrionales bacterium]|nr:AraC family transcriptional regulator [Desulfovibrionales bacterium]